MSQVRGIDGRALPLRGDDIDTDRIVPARFLRAVTFEGLEAHLFADDRAADPQHPFNDARFQGARILLVSRNFGCGSSREHAPQALYRLGIRAVVGESYSEIFFGNATTLGLACVAASRADVHLLMEAVEGDPGLVLAVDLEALEVRGGALRRPIALSSAVRESFLSGAWDATGLLRERPAEVATVASGLPYVRGFDA